MINEKCPLINIKLNALTKKFPKLDDNHLISFKDITEKFFNYLEQIEGLGEIKGYLENKLREDYRHNGNKKIIKKIKIIFIKILYDMEHY